MEYDYIERGDCLELMKELPDKSIDLVVTDPPYKFQSSGGGGSFGSKKRKYHDTVMLNVSKERKAYLDYVTNNGKDDESERLRILANAIDLKKDVNDLAYGVENEILDELMRVMKKVNIYIWCNKEQLLQYMNYFKDYNMELITWHKTNPVPMCNNKYLSDTEYLLFFREKGVKVYGEYATKKKYYVTSTNKDDKKKYKHPTIKPLNIIENLIVNSSQEGDVVLDPFLGSGTTSVACVNTNRHYIGFELDETYFNIAFDRLDEAEKVSLNEQEGDK